MPQTSIGVYCGADGTVPFVEWLNDLEKTNRKAWVKCLELIHRLENFGHELRRPLSGTLRDGVYELRAEVGNVQYRVLYFFTGQNVAIVSHGITKKSKMPKKEIDIAVARMKQVKSDPETYITGFQQ